MPRLLVVDDDPLVLKMLERILVNAGFQVLTAKNGLAAIRIVQSVQGDIDLLVSDVEMPEMGGTALAAAMRVSYPEVPILFISGNNHVLALPGQEPYLFLLKPFTHGALLRAIYRLLDGEPAQLAEKSVQAGSAV